MKNIFLLTFFLGSSLFSLILNQEIIWLDENLKETSQGKAKYYKVGTKLDGEITYYFKNRNVFRKVRYNKGTIEGNFFEFYDTGELKESGKYSNGLREGSWKVYYRSGKIKQKGKYSKGNKVGIWKTYHKNEN